MVRLLLPGCILGCVAGCCQLCCAAGWLPTLSLSLRMLLRGCCRFVIPLVDMGAETFRSPRGLLQVLHCIGDEILCLPWRSAPLTGSWPRAGQNAAADQQQPAFAGPAAPTQMSLP